MISKNIKKQIPKKELAQYLLSYGTIRPQVKSIKKQPEAYDLDFETTKKPREERKERRRIANVESAIELNKKIKEEIKHKIEKKKSILNYDKIVLKKILNVIETGESQFIKVNNISQLESLLNVVQNNFLGQRLVLVLPGGSRRALNEETLKSLFAVLSNTDADDFYKQEVVELISNTNELIIEQYVRTENRQQRRVGGFVRYLHNTPYDLSRYQLFSSFNIANYKENCLYVALQQCGLSQIQLNMIKSSVKNREVAKCDLKKLAIDMGITIKLHIYKKDSTSSNVDLYNKGQDEICNVALYENHYFIHENINLVIGNRKVKTSLALFRELFTRKETLLKEIVEYDLNKLGYDCDEIKSLDFDINKILEKNNEKNESYLNDISNINKILEKNNEKTINETYLNYISDISAVYFADFECFKRANQQHEAYQLGFERLAIREKQKEIFTCYNYVDAETKLSNLMLDHMCKNNLDCGVKFNKGVVLDKQGQLVFNKLDVKEDEEKGKIVKRIIIYFHNAKYDSCFFDYNKMYDLSFTVKDGSFYKMEFSYYFKNIKYSFDVRDTLKHLTFALAAFPEKFEMPAEFHQKEIIPYSYYTLENIKKRICKIEGAVNDLLKYKMKCSREDIKQFINNIEKWNVRMEDDDKCKCKSHSINLDVVLDKQGQLVSNKLDVSKDSSNEIVTAGKLQFPRLVPEGCLKHPPIIHVCGSFNIIAYSQKYNELDVKILKAGFSQWRTQVLEFTNNSIDILKVLTSASFAQKYFELNGAYVNVFKLNQMPRKFIEKTIFGGRCMASRNMKSINKGIIQDFDAVSLYPSAIFRLKELGGILCGIPKILNKDQLNKEFLDKCDGYFVEIKIKSMKDRDFPLIPCKEDGMLKYDTEKLVDSTIVVGKIQLEDLVTFCDCEYELIRGYYFNEGRDDKICNIIVALFEKRLQLKKLKSPLQEVIKLIMNSAYGKTIQKANDVKLHIKKDKEDKKNKNNYKDFINYNYDRIKEFNQIADSDNYLFETYENVNNHFSMPHIGSEILAMSKRIMSEVMCLAEDNGIDIIYQDTDSMHMLDRDVSYLSMLFEQKYGKQLIGGNMGQFHCDFDSKILKGKIFSEYSITLGKKSYLDVLTVEREEIKNEEDEHPIKVEGPLQVDYHVRMKGIPNDSLYRYCEKNKISIVELYEKLYNSEKIEFDLTCDNQKPKFEIKNFCTKTKLNFCRQVEF